MPGKKPYPTKQKPDKTFVKKATKITQDKFKGGLMEGSDNPVGMRSPKFERENANRERQEHKAKKR